MTIWDILIIILVVFALGYGGFLMYRKFVKGESTKTQFGKKGGPGTN